MFIWALLAHPDLFNNALTASPLPVLEQGFHLERFRLTYRFEYYSDPALEISYGALEQYPIKRRTKTDEQSPILRDVSLHEYPFSYHAAVGTAVLTDGIDYFLGW
jgi:hypothetical protein